MVKRRRITKIIKFLPDEVAEYFINTPIEFALNDLVDIETRVEFLLPFLGVPTNLKAYEYIKYALIEVCKDENKIQKITTGLYKEIADKYDSTPSRVERSMRHAIDITFTRMDDTVSRWLFGYSVIPKKGKCSNSEFIARLARLLTKF